MEDVITSHLVGMIARYEIRHALALLGLGTPPTPEDGREYVRACEELDRRVPV